MGAVGGRITHSMIHHWQSMTTRWAPTSCKWGYDPDKWPYKWVTGVIILLIRVKTPFLTGRGPPWIDDSPASSGKRFSRSVFPMYPIPGCFVSHSCWATRGGRGWQEEERKRQRWKTSNNNNNNNNSFNPWSQSMTLQKLQPVPSLWGHRSGPLGDWLGHHLVSSVQDEKLGHPKVNSANASVLQVSAFKHQTKRTPLIRKNDRLGKMFKVNHQLEPLTVIMASSSLLKDQAQGSLWPNQALQPSWACEDLFVPGKLPAKRLATTGRDMSNVVRCNHA